MSDIVPVKGEIVQVDASLDSQKPETGIGTRDFYRRYSVTIRQTVTLEIDVMAEEEDILKFMIDGFIAAYRRDPNNWQRTHARLYPEVVRGDMKVISTNDIGPARARPFDDKELEAGS